MKNFLREKIEKIKPNFLKGGKFEKFFPVWEAHETLVFQPDEITKRKGAHIRDANDMKRLMVTVIAALVPCVIFAMWNTGYLHYESLFKIIETKAVGAKDAIAILAEELGDKTPNREDVSFMSCLLFGAFRFIPVLIVSYAAGLGTEFAFSINRRHPVSEGFLVTGMLIPCIVPATVPLWQVALATIFAVVIGKEVFGGTGMNFLNPALTARAFLFFAYPVQLSGDTVWTDLGAAKDNIIEGFSGATVLSDAAKEGVYAGGYTFEDMFMGWIPGSMGETSTLMCIIGAVVLIATAVGSWRVMVSMVLGGLAMAYLLEGLGAEYFGVEHAYYHIVVGGFAFGTVFMATDPVSAAHTNKGKVIYGFLAGVFSILVRVVNPAYPEGVMLAILLMNVLAPLIDYYVVQANKKRRLKRATV